MTHKHYSPRNFQESISRMVSEASMNLPPLSRPQDAEFMRVMAGAALNAFFANFVSTYPEEAQREMIDAIASGDPDNVLQWFRTHADFENDLEIERRGSEVLAEIATKLPELMRQEYDSFSTED